MATSTQQPWGMPLSSALGLASHCRHACWLHTYVSRSTTAFTCMHGLHTSNKNSCMAAIVGGRDCQHGREHKEVARESETGQAQGNEAPTGAQLKGGLPLPAAAMLRRCRRFDGRRTRACAAASGSPAAWRGRCPALTFALLCSHKLVQQYWHTVAIIAHGNYTCQPPASPGAPGSYASSLRTG